jgi:hypothetical protein
MTPPTEVTDIAIFHNNRGLCYQKMVREKYQNEFDLEIKQGSEE